MKKYDKKSKAIAEWAEGQELPQMSVLVSSINCPEMSPTERKVLAVKLLPGSHKWTAKKKADMVGVCDKTWYRIVKDLKFQKLSVEYIKNNLSIDIPELWAKYVKSALNGNHVAMERILTQVGIFEKDKPGDTIVNVAIVEKEKEEKLERGLNRFGYTVNPDN